jgi:vacuolar-type H+-ATPase subunit H
MIEEHLSRIRSKEEQARTRTAEASARAAELVERARDDGAKGLGDTAVEVAELERSLMAAARRSADEKISRLRAENAKRLAALIVLAKKNHEKAVETVINEFRRGA